MGRFTVAFFMIIAVFLAMCHDTGELAFVSEKTVYEGEKPVFRIVYGRETEGVLNFSGDVRYTVTLCDGETCSEYYVSEDEFAEVDVGSVVRVKVQDGSAKIVEVVETVKPFYTVNLNVSRVVDKIGKIDLTLRPPFSGITIRDGESLFVIVTSLNFKKGTVTNTIFWCNESLKVLGKYSYTVIVGDVHDVESIVQKKIRCTDFWSCNPEIEKVGWYYVRSCGNTKVIVEQHSGIVLAIVDGRPFIPKMSEEIMTSDKPPEEMVETFLPNMDWSWSGTGSVNAEVPEFYDVVYKHRFKDVIKLPPLAEDGKVYVAGRKLYAIDERSGKTIWSVNITAKSYTLGEYLYVANSTVFAIDKGSGRVVWAKEVGAKTLILQEDGVITIGDRNLCRISGSGKVEWCRSFKEEISCVDGSVVAAGSRVYSINLEDGNILWAYNHWCDVSDVVYKDGKVLVVDTVGNLALIGENGSKLWEKDVSAGSVAVNDHIFASKIVGKKGFVVFDFSGETVSAFHFPDGEVPGKPIATKNAVVLPTFKPGNYSRMYLFNHRGEMIFKVDHEGEPLNPPLLGLSGGKIYAIFPYDREHHVLYVLADTMAPEIVEYSNFTKIRAHQTVDLWVRYLDKGGLHSAIFAYQAESDEWHYLRMSCGDTYCNVVLPPQQPNSSVKCWAVLIDKAGNHAEVKWEMKVED